MGDTPAEAAMNAALPATTTAGQADVADVRVILIVVGVSGSGKTTIATALAQRLGWPLEEVRRNPEKFVRWKSKKNGEENS
jgi:ABC-type glutathione transport system ATPase component